MIKQGKEELHIPKKRRKRKRKTGIQTTGRHISEKEYRRFYKKSKRNPKSIAAKRNSKDAQGNIINETTEMFNR